MTSIADRNLPKSKTAWYNDPKLRSIVFQVTLAVIVLSVLFMAVDNAIYNLQKAKIASGFDFFGSLSGFDISEHLIDYNNTSTYGRAFMVGLLNTVKVSVLGIFLATILGFTVGIARLSPNWLIAKIATCYVELIRNIPLLLQLLFWYRAVLKPLPDPRDSINVADAIFLNNRGLVFPAIAFEEKATAILLALVVAVVGSIAYGIFAHRRQAATGQRAHTVWIALAAIIGLPLIAFFAAGMPASLVYATKTKFNLAGGLSLSPEFTAILIGLTLYTAAFIAEIVRGGIRGVSRGQSEASRALGLSTGDSLRLVIIPQAMRIIIPPLTSQYLNLLKNSSLAVAIGYPELVQIFMGTVLNQTNRAIECVTITMLVYLAFSLIIASGMNWYNRRVALVER